MSTRDTGRLYGVCFARASDLPLRASRLISCVPDASFVSGASLWLASPSRNGCKATAGLLNANTRIVYSNSRL
jgi:hypothetical protein